MIAIAGGKGGCGKTTTALCLGRALSDPVRLVDADAEMPNLHAMAGVPRRPSLSASPGDPDAVARDCGGDARVVPAPRAAEGDPTTAVSALPDDEPTTLLDCPGGAGPDAAAPLRVADRAVVVTTACRPALRGAAKSAAMARALGCAVVGAVVTRTRAAPPGVDDLLDCPVLGAVPTVDADRPHEAEAVQTAYRRIADRFQAPASPSG